MSTTQRKLNLGKGPTKAIPAPPGSIAFRPPFHQRSAEAPRPDQRVHITADQLPESAKVEKLLARAVVYTSSFLIFLAGELAVVNIPWISLALFAPTLLYWFHGQFYRCGACKSHVPAQAKKCKNCGSHLV